jgi:hypothetical protein
MIGKIQEENGVLRVDERFLIVGTAGNKKSWDGRGGELLNKRSPGTAVTQVASVNTHSASVACRFKDGSTTSAESTAGRRGNMLKDEENGMNQEINSDSAGEGGK